MTEQIGGATHAELMARMGSAELTDWWAYYELKARDVKAAIDKAVAEAKR